MDGGLQTDAFYAALVALLTMMCMLVTVERGGTKASRRARVAAVAKGTLIAFLGALAGVYFLRHPAAADPLKHVVKTPADF